MSKVVVSEAEDYTRELGMELLREAVKEKLRERMGTRIQALAEALVDRAVADFDANVDIETRIAQHQGARRAADARVAEAARNLRSDKDKGPAGGGGTA
jgi:hypothetical protein